MDAKLIEKLDRRRYKYLLWMTIVLGLGYPAFIFKNFFPSDKFLSPLFIIGCIGAFLFIALLIAWGVEYSNIKKDPELKAALNDELYILHGYKSMQCSLLVTVTVSLALNVLSDVSLAQNWATPLTGSLVATIIIHVSAMTWLIARLIFMRK